MPRILIVDDEPDICGLLEDILADEGFITEVAYNGKKAKDKFESGDFDLILMDIWMPDVDGITLLSEFVKSAKKTPAIIMMSGHGTVETAVEATRLGAYDFLEKPLSTAKLLLTVKNALSNIRLEEENIRLRTRRRSFATKIIGKSQLLEDLRQAALKAANYTTPILLSGESGVGKSLCARFVHANSVNKNRPFVQVSAASILGSNMEHELFGSEIDNNTHPGKLDEAKGGTLYLKQIENMQLTAQTALVGALQNGEYKRVGGLVSIKTEFRVIASTSLNLEKAVRDGAFSEDLYYYLNVLNINLPTLQEHKEDINELIEHFLLEFTEVDGLPYRKFSVAAKNLMLQHDWFGNVIELENLIQRLLISGSGEEISPEEVKSNFAQYVNINTGMLSEDKLYEINLKSARDAFERGYLLHHLQKTSGNISQTAQNIGVERANLYRKIRVHKIDPKNLGQTK